MTFIRCLRLHYLNSFRKDTKKKENEDRYTFYVKKSHLFLFVQHLFVQNLLCVYEQQIICIAIQSVINLL